MTQAQSFGEMNFAHAQLGDKRRSKRLANLASERSKPIATLHRWQRVGWVTSRKVIKAGGRWAVYADAPGSYHSPKLGFPWRIAKLLSKEQFQSMPAPNGADEDSRATNLVDSLWDVISTHAQRQERSREFIQQTRDT